ncbi:DNA-3-methyladenine glycosylase family protein [Chelativorans salis]|uniref:DNA-3-methyladenine glycosylase II n=1 Tax=Chelativorans salis TaxID=2978478 RepID=A0ABT2LSE5_9HYPH|nr:DNA-3-methyladenine glycosylase 2 family protein [Chelativorans sp. EGI FJ00035]MCT7377456.1 DNA-3-methyladenine glycosylase 2 family protein [Chelativorans sp. EGI FJ00035]
MQRIETPEDIAHGLDALVAADRRLGAVRAAAGVVPLRRSPPGFHSLASVIVSQQVSRASADAIFGRLCLLVEPLTPERLLVAGEPALVQAGLSRAKQRALVALCAALADGSLDLEGLGALSADEAIAAMTTVPGIGPWTAQVYLLVAAGHADIFPAGDVALQSAAAHALALDSRPDGKNLALMAESWSPWRSVAARLFWAYYREMKGREAAPAA